MDFYILYIYCIYNIKKKSLLQKPFSLFYLNINSTSYRVLLDQFHLNLSLCASITIKIWWCLSWTSSPEHLLVLSQCAFPSAAVSPFRRIFRTWRECERLLADGLVDAAPLISHRLPMSQFEQAFQELLSGSACKILLDPQNWSFRRLLINAWKRGY